MLYFEDIRPGDVMRSSTYTVEPDEMIAFARRWDPVPIHIDPAVADAQVGGLTASGSYVLAVKSRLLHDLPPAAIIGSAGYDEVRFHEPLRPGDSVHAVLEWLDCRASSSKPDRGVVKLRISLVNQSEVTLMSHLDTLIVRRRPGPEHQ
ncbi:MAG: MaoC/PaaZ C-terminal domain-containing protein [Acidimicrobiales bacterium]